MSDPSVRMTRVVDIFYQNEHLSHGGIIYLVQVRIADRLQELFIFEVGENSVPGR